MDDGCIAGIFRYRLALPRWSRKRACLSRFPHKNGQLAKGGSHSGYRSFSLTLHTGQARSVTRVLLIFVGVFMAAAIDDSSLQ